MSKDGKWFHDGEPFQNEKLAQLFSRSIQFDTNFKLFKVKIGKEELPVALEDCAFFVTEIQDRNSPWEIKYSDGKTETLGDKRIRCNTESVLYILRQDGHWAKFLRPAHQNIIQYSCGASTLLLDGVVVEIET